MQWEQKHKPRPEGLLRWRAGALTEWTPVCAASVSALHQCHAASWCAGRCAGARSQRDTDRGAAATPRRLPAMPAEPVQIPPPPSRLFHYVMRQRRAALEKSDWRSVWVPGYGRTLAAYVEKGFYEPLQHNDGNSDTSRSRRFHSGKDWDLKWWREWQLSATIIEQTHKLLLLLFMFLFVIIFVHDCTIVNYFWEQKDRVNKKRMRKSRPILHCFKHEPVTSRHAHFIQISSGSGLIGWRVDLIEEFIFNHLGHQAVNCLDGRLAAETNAENLGIWAKQIKHGR